MNSLDRAQVSLRSNWFSRAAGWLAPQWTLRRTRARLELEILRQRYSGASLDRTTDGSWVGQTTADTEIRRDGNLLRARMRDLVRNNDLAASGIQTIVNNAVGTGIRPMPMTPSRSMNQRISDAWERWAEEECHLRDDYNFDAMTAMAVRGVCEGGDFFARLHVGITDARNGTLPIRLELLEAEQLESGLFDHADGSDQRRVRDGIEYDNLARPTAYYFRDLDYLDGTTTLTVDSDGHERVGGQGYYRVPRSMVAHVYERQRVQSRGVPWGAPAMQKMAHIDEWQEAELMRKKIEACVVGIVLNDDGDRPGLSAETAVTDASGNAMEVMEPGQIAYAAGARDIKFNEPANTGGIGEWLRANLQLAAAGWRIPYAILTGDLSQANFASSRQGINEFRRTITMFQRQVLVPMWCRPIWRWFTEYGELEGLFETEDGRIPVKWISPRFESVDPLKDTQADILEVRSGFSTLGQQVSRRGLDPEELVDEWARMGERLDDMELIFDTDPRRTTRAGSHQGTMPGDEMEEMPPEDGDGEMPPPPDGEEQEQEAEDDAGDDDDDDDDN